MLYGDYLIAKDEMVMECPHCQTSFYPQMHTQLIGSNSKGMNVFVYYQMCPECNEPVVGVRELKDLLALSIDVQDLTLLTKPK
jgi:phage terminase large subunit GpA-like protein